MAEIITATFQDGAFVPDQTVHVPAGTRVRLTVEPVYGTAKDALENFTPPTAEAIAEFNALCDRMSLDSGGVRMTRDELHERR